LTSPKDRLLDLLVFAPAGIALTLVEELPELADKGRNRIEGQAATARVVGQFVVKMGCREISKRAKQLLDGQLPGTATASRPAPAADATKRRPAPSKPAPASGATVSPASQTVSSHVPSNNGKADSEHLAIPAYDTLSASQVVKRLAGLSQDELIEVAQHERSNRHRATILNRVEQLLSGEPSYDST
jgi:hypothetical protein